MKDELLRAVDQYLRVVTNGPRHLEYERLQQLKRMYREHKQFEEQMQVLQAAE